MPRYRHITVLLVAALLSGIALANGPSQVLAGTRNPDNVCSPDQLPTQWQDDLHPPPTIRVRRSHGPDAGTVETVNFWDYVATVLRAEFSSGADKPALWMRAGALAVKQYGWYYTMHWRGGSVTVTNPDDGTTTVECYDVRDTTADQLYKPARWSKKKQEWVPTNVPTLANYRAMAETWDMSLRKWAAKKGISRLFLTGYRSGRKKPCGTDATGFKLKQKSLRDCAHKGLTLDEALRKYFEPRLLEVNTRSHDVLPDNGTWMGDLGLLDIGADSTAWRLYPASTDGFSAPVTGSFDTAISGYGVGNVDAPSAQLDADGTYLLPAGSDPALLSDLIMLDASRTKLLVARAAVDTDGNGIGYDAPTAVDVSGGPVDRLLVGDFNGDLLVDAGLLRDSGDGTATLSVMLSQGDGTFGPEQAWWSGPLDLTTDVFAATGDVNGDGKADLIMRDADGAYWTAASRPSCSFFDAWGACPEDAVGAPGLDPAVAAFSSTWTVSDVRNAVGDYDRDGRADVIAAVKDGSGVQVYGLPSQGDGTFGQQLLASLDSVSWDSLSVAALNLNSDGMADLALVQQAGDGSTSLQWLSTQERGKYTPASMTATSVYDDAGLSWSASFAPY